ncbi:hypothetical protein ACGFZP_12720 [Kitasatospora sp. NPDC048239]|uniref:hypothetical protein n=1 Tax=Kitasatospora sp. NPDC048239 TaxID=3364046 RepID=UPI00371F015D
MQERTKASLIAASAATASAALHATGTEEAAVLIGMAGIVGSAATGIRGWLKRLETRLTDTTAERRQLDDEIARCQVAHAGNQTLKERLIAGAAVEHAAREQRLADAITAIRQEFEDRRAAELVEAFEAGARWERNRQNGDDATTNGNLIFLSQRRTDTKHATSR